MTGSNGFGSLRGYENGVLRPFRSLAVSEGYGIAPGPGAHERSVAIRRWSLVPAPFILRTPPAGGPMTPRELTNHRPHRPQRPKRKERPPNGRSPP